MDSISDDDFLAGLAPPTVTSAAPATARTASEEAIPKTPPVATTPGGTAVLGRRPVADATSTLLNFLKQEQAIITEQLPKPALSLVKQQQQHQLDSPASGRDDAGSASGAASLAATPSPLAGRRGTAFDIAAAPPSSSDRKSSSPSSPLADHSSSQELSAAAPASAGPAPAAGPLPAASAPARPSFGAVKQAAAQWEASVQRTTPVAGGRRATAPIAVATPKTAAIKSDSWDLDDDMLPDGSAAEPGAGRQNSNSGADESGAGMYMPSFVHSRNNSARTRVAADPSESTAPTKAAVAATADGYSISTSSKLQTSGAAAAATPVAPPLPPAAHVPAPAAAKQQDEAEKQQVASQLAAALARRAQLQQQQQQQQPPTSSSISPATRATSNPAPQAVTTASSRSSRANSSSPSTGGAGSMSPLSAGSTTPMKWGQFAGSMPSAAESPVAPNTVPNAGKAAEAPTMQVGPIGGLLAKGFADLGISEPAPAASSPSMAAPSAMMSPSLEGQLPPGVTPIAAAGGSGFSSLRPATAAPASSVPLPGVTPLIGQGQGTMRPDTAPSLGRNTSNKGSTSSSSAAAAVALLNTLTSSTPSPPPAAAAAGAASAVGREVTAMPSAAAAGCQQYEQLSSQLAQQPITQQQQYQQQQQTPAPVHVQDFQAQMQSVHQLVGLQQEVADLKFTIARLRQHTEEQETRHQSEINRLRSELEAVHFKAAADLVAAREQAAEDIAAAEARAQRAAALEKDVVVAQLQAQAAAITQEREALAAQRINTDMLASLSEQVRGAAAATAERETRALAALEKSVAERNAAASARERLLQEREDAVCTRARELDTLKQQLSKLLADIEAQAASDKEVLAAQTARLAKESARLEAMQGALLSEREETKLALVLEKQALEEARAARIKERESLIADMTAERRRLAEEAASTSRAAEEARANLLDLKGRVAEYEATAAAALRQARQEEAHAAAIRAGIKAEQEQLETAKKELQAASRKLDDDRTQLQEWGARLAALTREFDDAKAEVKAARMEIQDQRESLAAQVAALSAAQEQLEVQRQAILEARIELDRQRVQIAEERAALTHERISAAQAARGSAAAAAAVAAAGGQTPTKHSPTQTARAGGYNNPTATASQQRSKSVRQSTGGMSTSNRSKNVLKRLVDELQIDKHTKDSNNSRQLSSTVKAQREFLHELKKSNSSGVLSSTSSLGGYGLGNSGVHHTASSHNAGLAGTAIPGACDALAAVKLSSPLRANVPSAAGAAMSSNHDVLALLQQLAQLQQLASRQQLQNQNQHHGLVSAPAGVTSISSPSTAAAADSKAAKGLQSKQQQNHQAQEMLQQLSGAFVQQQQHQKQCSTQPISRVSSNLSHMLALSASGSSEGGEGPGLDCSVDGDGVELMRQLSNDSL